MDSTHTESIGESIISYGYRRGLVYIDVDINGDGEYESRAVSISQGDIISVYTRLNSGK